MGVAHSFWNLGGVASFPGQSSKFKTWKTSKSHICENCYPRKFPAIRYTFSAPSLIQMKVFFRNFSPLSIIIILVFCVCLSVCLLLVSSRERDVVAPCRFHHRGELRLPSYPDCISSVHNPCFEKERLGTFSQATGEITPFTLYWCNA